MEGTHRIEFQEWYQPSGGRDVRRRSPGFRVWSNAEGEGRGFFVGVLLSRTASAILTARLGVKDEGAAAIDEFLLMYGMNVIRDRLRDGSWVDDGKGTPQEVLVHAEELDGILRLQSQKECDYQQVDGRDLYCLAAALKDETALMSVGVRLAAPTSRSTCAACSMPDARLVCSHLHHPQVFGVVAYGSPMSRDLGTALCDIGREEVATPRLCRAGGHECWVSILEPPPVRSVPRSPPRALLEAFDYLDTSWRLAFGEPLLAIRSAAGTADIIEPCANREEFQSRVSAIAELLKSLMVSDELLEEGVSFPSDHTLARLRSSLANRLEADEFERAARALDVLSASVRVRAAMQHEDAAVELPDRLRQLGVSYPLSDWGEAWEEVRSRLTVAVAELAEIVRSLAVAR